MKYQQPTFSAPVSNGKLTDEEYEVAVGLREPFCDCDEPRTADGDNCLTCGKPL